jgi:lipopolysaccharide export system ATP-binding protein
MNNLRIVDIKKSIKKTEILHGISLEINSGEIVGLLGPNGAGKTTTFYTVCGLVKPTSGKVFFDDEDITAIPLHKRALKGIGYLPQESSIFKDLSVEENLLLAAEIVIKDNQNPAEKTDHGFNISMITSANNQIRIPDHSRCHNRSMIQMPSIHSARTAGAEKSANAV